MHRLLANHASLLAARVVIVCAGMEGALPSVVGGLVGVPVLAVPDQRRLRIVASRDWRRCWAC